MSIETSPTVEEKDLPHIPLADPNPGSKRKTMLFVIGGLLLIVLGLGIGMLLIGMPSRKTADIAAGNQTEKEIQHEKPSTSIDTILLSKHAEQDLTALPLGDQKYGSSPKKGTIYLCRTQMDGGGAFQAGPWINESAKTWDMTKKATVDGAITWPNSQWSITKDGTTRVLSGNGLPSHITGVYPISASDDAYAYDRNPNAIKTQNYSLRFPTTPSLLSTPECVGGEVGILLSGIPMFNGFDAGGRDAVAWEVQDSCSGHPQVSGQYHYHGPSKCIKDETASAEHSALIGYAFDGFGIFGVKGENGQELTTADLDECHGHTHAVSWDGKETSLYHYHMTYDFPYSVSCFRGKKQVQGPLGASVGNKEDVPAQPSNVMRPPSGSGQRPPPLGMPPPR